MHRRLYEHHGLASRALRTFLTRSFRVALACSVLPRPALAQGSPSRAETLFEQGLDAMRAGQYESACPALSESYRLEPLPGALFTLAECEAAWGKLTSAVDHYQTFLKGLPSLPPERRDKFDERRRMALEKIATLIATAPEVTIDAPLPVPPGLIVKRNGEVVEPNAFGVGKKVDPGEYVIFAELDGETVFERRVVLSERDRARVEVKWSPRPASEAAVSRAAVQPARVPPAPSPSASSGTRTWVYVSGGAAALGLATGFAAGGVAWSKKGSIEQNCPNRECNPEGRRAVSAGQRAATISTIGFSVGLVGAAGAALLLVLPRQHAQSAAASKRPTPVFVASREFVELSLAGRFE